MSGPARQVLKVEVLKVVDTMFHFTRVKNLTVRHDLSCGHSVTLIHKHTPADRCYCSFLPCPVC